MGVHEVAEAIRDLGLPAMLKAQVLHGGRGKAGLVASIDNISDGLKQAEKLSADGRVFGILIEEKLDTREEWFLAISIDDVLGQPVVMLSSAGGVDVEERIGGGSSVTGRFAVHPVEGLRKFQAVSVLKSVNWPRQLLMEGADFVFCAYEAFRSADAELLEINPVIVTHEEVVVAGDAKIVVDDSALYRHALLKEKEHRESSAPIEQRARNAGLLFVDLDGDIALLTMGAGNAMAVMDAISLYGGAAANFMDSTGGQVPEGFHMMAELVVKKAESSPKVKAIVISMVLTASSLKDVVDGLVAGFVENPAPVPVFGCIQASAGAVEELSREEGLRRLEAAGIIICEALDDAARRAVLEGIRAE